MEGSSMAVGTVRAFVIDVNDLAVGERFWSAVTGNELQFSGWAGQFSRLGKIGQHSILLQLVPEAKGAVKNRAHVDITVPDIDRAIDEIVALGGSLVRPKGVHSPDDPRIEWAVMADPFGNEFCIIRDL
jgi:predicted enzyme related to lactoylglutathione lyase